jgi:RNA polymerase sigma factor (sigma-70 family)
MVFGVCRRVLVHHNHAEDPFQATFLVLVRKAASIRPREQVGPWLHGVALRTASKARCRAARRRVVERQVHAVRLRSGDRAMSAEAASDEASWRDLRPVLDAELDRLPEVYRAPVVLCDLEGASRGEAARRLGVPEGTISSRLARGREMLGQRLRRRGVALSAGVLALVLARNVAAALPPKLVETTIIGATSGGVTSPVAALAEGVMHAMFYSQCKFVAAVLTVAGLVALAFGVGTHQALAEKPQPAAVAAATLAADKPEVGPSIIGVVVEVDAKKHELTLRIQEDPTKKGTRPRRPSRSR